MRQKILPLAVSIISLAIVPAFHVGTLSAADEAPAAVPDAAVAYEVTIKNETKGQPLSPPVVVAHSPSVHVWEMGKKASDAMRALAEDGVNTKIVEALKDKATDITAAGEKDIILPGQSLTLTINCKHGDVISVATMLSATNDGFTGVDSAPFSQKDERPQLLGDALAYDAGTEENTEKASDVPYPSGGKGHVATVPQDVIRAHQGITGKGDLDVKKFGWANTVARFTIQKKAADSK